MNLIQVTQTHAFIQQVTQHTIFSSPDSPVGNKYNNLITTRLQIATLSKQCIKKGSPFSRYNSTWYYLWAPVSCHVKVKSSQIDTSVICDEIIRSAFHLQISIYVLERIQLLHYHSIEVVLNSLWSSSYPFPTTPYLTFCAELALCRHYWDFREIKNILLNHITFTLLYLI